MNEGITRAAGIRDFRLRIRGAILLAAALVVPLTAGAADWPGFLGPNRDGISAETGLIENWTDGGPKQVWRRAVDTGMSGVAISGGQVVTLMQDTDRQYVVSFDARSGKPLWRTDVAPPYGNQMGDGPRATPTIADGTAFVFTGQGILAALHADSGRQLWSTNAIDEVGGTPAEYGNASSPLVVGNVVVVQTGAPDAAISAFDRRTGRLTWKAGSGAAGYSSPIAGRFGGQQQVIAFAGFGAYGINPEDGALYWSHPWKTDFDCNTASPVLVDADSLLLSSGENHGSTILTGGTAGDGFQLREAWSSKGPRSVLRAEWQTPVVVDGHAYGMDNVGAAGPVTNLTCVKVPEGNQVWQKRRFGKSNLIAADGKLFISTLDGELVVVRATPDGYDEIGRAEVSGATRQAPALANGLLYLRDERAIVCLDVHQ